MKTNRFLRGIKAVLIMALLLGAHGIQGQNKVNTSHLNVDLQVNGISIQSQLKECSYPKETNTKFEYLLLEVRNTLDIPLRVEFDKIPYYDGNCVNCKEFPREEMKVILDLSPQEVISGTCANNVRNRMRVFVSMSQHTQERLTSFRIENVKVSPLDN